MCEQNFIKNVLLPPGESGDGWGPLRKNINEIFQADGYSTEASQCKKLKTLCLLPYTVIYSALRGRRCAGVGSIIEMQMALEGICPREDRSHPRGREVQIQLP